MNTSNDVYVKAIKKIISEQESIIGPLAFDQARKVAGLQISPNRDISLVGNAKDVLSHLVEQYEHFFGRASIEVCKDALRQVNPNLSSEDLPDILK